MDMADSSDVDAASAGISIDGSQQQLVFVSEDGNSYIYPTDQTATTSSSEGLVTYIYGGDGITSVSDGGQAGADGDVQYLLVSADEATGMAQQQQQQYIVIPQGSESTADNSDVSTKADDAAKKCQPQKLEVASSKLEAAVVKSAAPVSVLLTSSATGSKETPAAVGTTAEVKVKGGTARVTILPATSKSPSSGASTTGSPAVTTIPIRIVSRTDTSAAVTQTISLPLKSSPKVTVSVKSSPSKLPPAVVSLPKVAVVPATSTPVVSSPAPKKIGRPKKEIATPAKADPLHQLTKPGGVTKTASAAVGKSPNVIVVPIQISKEMIAAKQANKPPATTTTTGTEDKASDVAKDVVKVVKAGNPKVTETAKEKSVTKDKDVPAATKTKKVKEEHKLEQSPPAPTPTRRSKRESNLSMKLAEWGLLPSSGHSGSRHAVTDDEEEEEDEEVEEPVKDESGKDDEDDDVPLIKTVAKPLSTAATASSKKVVTVAKETTTVTSTTTQTPSSSKPHTTTISVVKVTQAVTPVSKATTSAPTATATTTKTTPAAPVAKATPVSGAVSKGTQPAAAVAKGTPTAASVSKATPSSGILKKAAVTQPTSSTAPKLLQNKSLMCKPIMMTKATSCNPIRITKATQTDEDGDLSSVGGGSKTVVPLPVPIFVPTPMAMYNSPTPYPVPLPLPIPVPCLIPTTRNSIAAIMKQLQDLHDSLPSDPFEADVLKMAEAVAEATDEQDVEHKTVDRKGCMVESVSAAVSNTDGPVDVLEMAMRLASDADPLLSVSKSLNGTDTCSNASGAPAAKRARLAVDSLPVDDIDDMDVSSQQPVPSPLVVVEPLRGPTPAPVIRQPINDSHMRLKYSYGINAWKQWVTAKNVEIGGATTATVGRGATSSRLTASKLFKSEILQCNADELNAALSLFVREVRKPTGQTYAADSIYYLCLGIQHYLFENGRVDNIFTDIYYERFTDALHELLSTYEVRLNTQGMIVCRVSEEHLWEARLLGAHSPRVLLNTLVYFNTKYFMLHTTENHLSLSFSNILKQWKKNNSIDGKPIRSVYLRYNTIGYSPSQTGSSAMSGLDATAAAAHRRRTLDPTPYEQLENIDNPLRCPVKLYEFYLSKCPESIRNRNDVFYLTPEPSCVPDSPVWYSAQPLSTEAMNKMLCRIRVVREIQESQLNQSPAAASVAIM